MSLFSSRVAMPLIATCTALVLLSGCSSGGGDTGDPQGQSADGSGEPSGATVSDTVEVTRSIEVYPNLAISGAGDSADAPPSDGAGATAPADRTRDTVEIGFAGLAARGKLASLTLTYTPDFASVGDDEAISIYDMFNKSSAEPSLIDAENLKSYSVAREKSGPKLGPEDVYAKVKNHQTMTAVYMFAVPAVDKVDVYLGGRLAFDSVPVTR